MQEKVLMKGNEAIAEAAILAGCRHYLGYPITPQTEVAAYMAKKMPKIGGTFLQAESEIAAINMVYGVAATGKRPRPPAPVSRSSARAFRIWRAQICPQSLSMCSAAGPASAAFSHRSPTTSSRRADLATATSMCWYWLRRRFRRWPT